MSDTAQDLGAVATAIDGINIDGPGAEDDGEVMVSISTADVDVGPILLPATREQLFNTDGYLGVPAMDGHATDKLVFAFGGSISFDATDDEGQELFNALTLGRPIDLNVAGFVAGKQGTYKENEEGESSVAGKISLKVTTIYLRKPEDLG